MFAAQILRKADCVLGLATGSTPLETYAALTAMYERGALDFGAVRSFNLDEYVGMKPDQEQSYFRFMYENLFSKVNIPQGNYFLPDGAAADVDAECARYEAAIEAAGGIDLQFLGLGHDGHIGFNEPADHFPLATHCVDLAEQTIEANKRFFASADDVPRRAISLGVGTIMRARRTLLIATGADKADAVYGLVRGAITPSLPASALRLHPHCVVLLDEEAASRL